MADQYNGQWRKGQSYTQNEGRYERDDEYDRGRSGWQGEADRGYGQYGYSRSDWDRSYDQYGSGNYSQGFEQTGQGSSEWNRDYRRDPDWERDYGQYSSGRMDWGSGYGRPRRGSSQWDRDYQESGRHLNDQDYRRYRRSGSEWDQYGSGDYKTGRDFEGYGRSSWEGNRDYGQYGRSSSGWGRDYGQYSRGGYPMSGSWGGQRRYRQSNADWDRDYGQYGRSGSDWERSPDRYSQGSYRADQDFEGYGRGRAEWRRNYERDADQDRGYGQYGGSGRDYSMRGSRGDHRRYGQGSSEQDRDYGRYGPSSSDRENRQGGYDYDWEDDYSQRFEDFGTTAGLQRRGDPSANYSEFWSTPGPHYGRGPRGYQRSNERIMEDVCERLTQHGQINAEDIEIEVNNGQVILKGTVDSRQAKRLAEDVTESVSGISQVMNQLQVRQKGQRQTEEQSSKPWPTKETTEGTSA